MGLLFEVTDPTTQETFRLMAVKNKSGGLSLRRLPAQNTSEGATPRMAEIQRAFAMASHSARGNRFDGPIPPAAMRVQELLPRMIERRPTAPQERASSLQEYYQSLLTADEIATARSLLSIHEEGEKGERPRLALPRMVRPVFPRP